MNQMLQKEYYNAFLQRNSQYEGTFFVGVKTTGIFCRPTCPAKKPKFENCEFFLDAKSALYASYRPCKKCNPLFPPNSESDLVQKLVKAVEKNPEKRWKTVDFAKLSIHEKTARRQFQKRFGMTFIEYARARRMGIAMKQIRSNISIIDTQLSTGFESSSGFRDAFSHVMGKPPSSAKDTTVLKAVWIDTPLGPMISLADEKLLYLLEFVDRRGLEKEIENLRFKLQAAIIPGSTPPLVSIEKEVKAYFQNGAYQFTTPIKYFGSPFQQTVWKKLQEIPPGKTISYAQLAAFIGKPTACRAVANANGKNQFAIMIPCHRVINTSGQIGGYGGGIPRKKWLIEHEANR